MDSIEEFEALACYGPGWDNRQAAPANLASFRDAKAFARIAARRRIDSDASIHADGNAVLTIEGDRLFASLCFVGGGTIAAYVRNGAEEWDGEVPFDGRTIPEPIEARIGAARAA